MIYTILNVFAIFIATVAVLIFILLFGFFIFIMYACVYIGWKEINSVSIFEIWERLKK